MVRVLLDGHPPLDAAVVGQVPEWSAAFRELVGGLRHGLNGRLSSIQAILHMAVEDAEIGASPAAELRESLAALERLIQAMEPMVGPRGPQEPEPIALDQLVDALRPTLALHADARGVDFVLEGRPRPVLAPWAVVADAVLLLLARAGTRARAEGVRRVALAGEEADGVVHLVASLIGPAGGRVDVGSVEAPLLGQR